MSDNPTDIAAEVRPSIAPIDLGTPRSIHLVGIGGAGMRAIARVLLTMGHSVSGSDRAASAYLDELAALGARVVVGHDVAHVGTVEMICRSSAVPDDDAEVQAARDDDVPVHSRAEMLAAISELRPAILVAGTHGKTTTSSMLAVVLDHAGYSPSFVIGSDVGYFGTGARWAASEHFVVEADESDGTFLVLPGAHAVVTSLDPDHLEFFGTEQRLEAAFVAFVESIPGTIAVCIDDRDTQPLLHLPGVVTYGTTPEAALHIANIEIGRDTTDFDVTWHGEPLGRAAVGLPGHHNALNAAAAIVIALSLGIDFASVIGGLAAFSGVARRFETRGEQAGVRFVDDYAHLPAEVEAAIATATSGPWNRVIAAYQPHRYSRTEALGASFATSFRGVDELVLTDIYPSGEAPRAGVTGRILFDAVTAACPDLALSWQPTLDQVVDHLAASVGPGDLCLTLGAGDLTTVPDRVLERLRATSPASAAWLAGLKPQLTASVVHLNEPLGARTTYRVGGAALAIVEVGSQSDLELVVSGAIAQNTPLLVLGKGSNMLVADRGFHGVALVLAGDFEAIDITDGSVTLGGAVSLPVAARRTVAHSLAGFEWAVGVPGSIGGAVAMNAGGHGSDMAAAVVHATIMNLATGQVEIRTHADLGFGYRTSSVRDDELVVGVTLELGRGDRAAGEAMLSEIVRWRRDNQPGGQNAGSVFTNPPGDSAGRLIDVAGGKGLRVGSASVSEKHANFIQCDPSGRASDVRVLMALIAELVKADSGVELTPETRLVGFP